MDRALVRSLDGIHRRIRAGITNTVKEPTHLVPVHIVRIHKVNQVNQVNAIRNTHLLVLSHTGNLSRNLPWLQASGAAHQCRVQPPSFATNSIAASFEAPTAWTPI